MSYKGGGQKPGRRLSPAVVLSIGVHLVAAVLLMRLLVIPRIDLFGNKAGSASVERIGFLRLVKTPGTPAPGRDGGNDRPVSRTPAVELLAPGSIPTTLPPVATTPPSVVVEEGSGPLVGSGGPARGIKPVFSDPRLWSPPGKIVSAPRTLKQDLDSIIATTFGPIRDSIGVMASQRAPNDWTVGQGNHKWGIDSVAIRLGKFSIPNALLAMLPLNVTGNPTTRERSRALDYMHRDISEHAQQAINQADFNKAVRSIRQRKERERAALQGSASESAKLR